MGNEYYLGSDVFEVPKDMSALETYLGVVIMKEGTQTEVVRTYHSGITE